MFLNHIQGHDKLYLPLCGNMYLVSVQGDVSDFEGSQIPIETDLDGDACVRIFWTNGLRLYKVGLLVAHTFKPVNLPIKHWGETKRHVL